MFFTIKSQIDVFVASSSLGARQNSSWATRPSFSNLQNTGKAVKGSSLKNKNNNNY